MTTSARCCWWGTALLVLAGCNPFTEPPKGQYAEVLERGEKVTEALQYGHFTVLYVEYRQGGGSLMSAEHQSMRLIHGDQVVVRQADFIERWTDFAEPVYLARLQDQQGVLALVHEQQDKPVVEKIAASAEGYQGTDKYLHGFPLSPGKRYFPGQQSPGFLVSAFPLKATVLPRALDGGDSLQLHALASVSPDGKSFAYVDSAAAPAVVMVVDGDGKRREPIPLPRIYLPQLADEYANPYQPLWDWSRAVLAWRKSGAGSWDVLPSGTAPGAAGAGNVVEQLFIDEQSGYRNCFAAANAACLPGWRAASATGKDAAGTPPFAYVPTAPVNAFGAPVSQLLLSKTCCGVASYHLYLDAAPAAVVAQLSARLQSGKIPFVRTDQCPPRRGNEDKCAAQLAEKLKRPESQGRELEQLLNTLEPQQGVVFVMPTMAVAVRANEQGGSIIQTLMRADFSRQD
ncbi:hypothetical protein [Janthinobacterium sp. RB2R34]|uniref:hypothetical protein n=1 Tax=Janthinobacterium sp. RB2R34 TaxID=3424193 RepID=UPI003F1F51E7